MYCSMQTLQAPNKLILYSRSSTLIHSLPGQFSHSDSVSDETVTTVRNIIINDPKKVIIRKLSYLTTQNAVQTLCKEFIDSIEVEVLLILADMNNVSTEIINHTRVIIEEAEIEHTVGTDIPKLFVLLLHFPALFHKHCYPTLFLKGWDHIYLDCIAHHSLDKFINIEDWLKTSWSAALQNSVRSASSYSLQETVRSFMRPTIPILLSRIEFGDNKENSFNSIMNPKQRYYSLEKLLFNYKIGDVLCELFSSYWTPKVQLEALKRSAIFSKLNQSNVSITESVNTEIKSLFFDFCVFMISSINKDNNFDILFSNEISDTEVPLFKSIFRLVPLPKLNHIPLLSKASMSIQPLKFKPSFPFFAMVFKLLEDLTQNCLELTNIGSESFNEGTIVPETDPEERLKKLIKFMLDDVLKLRSVSIIIMCIFSMCSKLHWSSTEYFMGVFDDII